MPDTQDTTLERNAENPFESTQDFPTHWIADAWGPIDRAKVSRLADSIREHGLAQPILLADDDGVLKVADGRHRHAACQLAKIAGRYEVYDGESVIEYAISLNADKVDRGPSQRAMAAAMLAEGSAKKDESANLPIAKNSLPSRFDVSERLIRHALVVCAWCRDSGSAVLSEQVWSGELAVSAAAEQVKRYVPTEPRELRVEWQSNVNKRQVRLAWIEPDASHGAPIKGYQVHCRVNNGQFQRVWTGEESEYTHPKLTAADESGNAYTYYYRVYALNAAGRSDLYATATVIAPDMGQKYDVVYADPPWRYDFSATNSREIENQYPTMTLAEICGMKVAKVAADDAVLFLWATSPKIREALKVIEAWGFEYKTCAVWDKQKIGMGYYFRQRHELLLVATRGNPGVPEPENRPGSVIESPRSEHSAKPEIVYGLLERMYPTAKRIELFSRTPQGGWDAWGDQSGGR